MSIDDVVADIVEKKLPCFFVSPHLDDAVFSAGNLIAYLSQKTSVSVVTVFTKADSGPYTLSARAYLRQCHFRDAQALFARRQQEDREACAVFGASVFHLGFVDALWRKTERLGNGVLSDFIPELRHRYPSYRLHVTSGRLVWEDLVLMEEISHRLKSIVGELSGGAVFAPWGIGNHIDHIITREVCLRTFSSLILWSDFPYNVAEAVRESIRPTNVLSNPQTLTLHPNLSDKKSLIRLYQTQVVAMFPRGGIPLVPEQYAVFQKEEDEFSPHFLRQPSLHREAEAHEVIAPKKY